MSKRSVFILFSIISISAIQAGEMVVSRGAKPLALHHHKNKFTLLRENAAPVTIHPAFMDKELRSIPKDKLDRLMKAGAYLQLNKMNNCDDYSLRLKGGLNGGGAGGATVGFFVGKIAVSLIGHGSIVLVSSAVGLFCPPAGTAVGIALESALAVPIETLSVTVGCATGVLGGVATGPV